MRHRQPKTIQQLLCGTAAVAISAWAGAAWAEERAFNIEPQPLSTALMAFGTQSGHAVMAPMGLMDEKTTRGFSSSAEPEVALAQLLQGTGLTYTKTGDTFAIVQEGGSPQGSGAAGGGATVEALIVTAQKREEDIQDVPIAISAFSQEDLTRSQIAGGPDLMTQVPNLTFTKTNFSGYSIQIRGIGTQAISATVDPAVAVAFNNTPFIRNRFFEQEFYDLQRVEVLRGPQGTLYGRNATAGVVNLLTARPKNFLEARLSADVGNYSSTRLEGMVNLPLVEDIAALRIAGAWTKRDGYVTNTLKGRQTDGRDLWSARATLSFLPTDDFRAYLTYEHFEEDDDRLRSGKQLCTRHEPPEFLIPDETQGGVFGANIYISQGCKMGSLYDDEAFQVPYGFSLPYYSALGSAGLPIFMHKDPYASTRQSRDLRSIETSIEPVYQAKTDIIHLAMEYDLTDSLTLTSETGYNADELFSFNDYNRFNTTPNVFDPTAGSGRYIQEGILDENGVFCDPQLGCANRLVAADVSTARSDQFSQEFRLSSDFDGPFNFHIGANFLRHDTVDKYYVFINTLSMYAAIYATSVGDTWDGQGVALGKRCSRGFEIVTPGIIPPIALTSCMYIDPNPISSLDDQGRNYFLSKNPFRLISYAAFGEAVYNITPDLKVTAGLRYTVDKKHAPIHPSWLLVHNTIGLPVEQIIEQEWREPTGRFVVDWKPRLGFTDETLLYASYAHGYKAGGVNPPLPGGLPLGDLGDNTETMAFIVETQPPEFGPEFIDAFEIGTKNSLLDGRVTLNAGAFYYDYEGYQISHIANRSAVNLNFDAEVWGAELELDWRPLENLKISFKGGYEKTRLADDQFAIDIIDRTAGDPNWFVRKSFPSIPSNCIVPLDLMLDFGAGIACASYLQPDIDPITQLPYVPNPTVMKTSSGAIVPLPSRYDGYPGFRPGDAPGAGAGIAKNVGGNELPNAPDFTTTISVDYTIPLPSEWLLTLHGDFYRQSEAWTRIFNEDPYDRLEPFSQVNLAAIFTNEPAGMKVMAYVKNALDKDNITGAFLNSDDSGLTTNVFLNEPRLYGLRVTKEWTGQAWWTSRALRRHQEYPFRVELGGGPLRAESENAWLEPTWADEFTSPTLPYPLDIQDDDLDWGDTRTVRLTYSPPGSPWNVRAGVRYGRTNGSVGANDKEFVPGGWPVFEGWEDLYPPSYAQFNRYYRQQPNWTNAKFRDHEEHEFIDFSVGRDLDIGGLSTSTVNLGLQYAQFRSESQAELHGRPDSYVPPEDLVKYFFGENPVTAHIYHANMSTEREFEGTGPVLSWEASKAILGGQDTGLLNIDWSVTGGVLFGKQETSAASTETADYYRWSGFDITGRRPGSGPTSSETTVTGPIHRTDDVTVPTFGASLGLSYSIDRVRVGAGYEWQRYQDVLDGGFMKAEQVDRDIHGPYFKLSVGFGG